jgi:hypothetical protein
LRALGEVLRLAEGTITLNKKENPSAFCNLKLLDLFRLLFAAVSVSSRDSLIPHEFLLFRYFIGLSLADKQNWVTAHFSATVREF